MLGFEVSIKHIDVLSLTANLALGLNIVCSKPVSVHRLHHFATYVALLTLYLVRFTLGGVKFYKL